MQHVPCTPRAVVFDFDGVIANTEDLYLGAYQEVFARRGWLLERRTYYTRYLGYDDRGMLKVFADDYGLDLSQDDVEMIMHEKEAAFLQRIAAGSVLYRGARECIDRIG
jgi:beta-phosphoglucomutase